MIESRLCNCEECSVGKYKQEDFVADLSKLDVENRPIGVSGYLRVKDDAPTLEQCIESVVTTLDELIIAVQPCSDNSLEIAQKLEKKYPNKIKVYNYKPRVDFGNGKEPVDNPQSVHSIVNFYNYTLTKCTYSYGVKIDGDQIYITSKLQVVFNAYRGIRFKLNTIDKIKHFFLSKNQSWLIKKYFTKISDKILANKDNELFLFCFCGVNLFKVGDNKDKLGVPLISYAPNYSEIDKYRKPFNGGRDHFIHKMSKDRFFQQQPNSKLEYFNTDDFDEHGKMITNYIYYGTFNQHEDKLGGVYCIHTGLLKPNKMSYEKKNLPRMLLNLECNPYLEINFFFQSSYSQLQSLGFITYLGQHQGVQYSWNIDRLLLQKIKLPPYNLYDKHDAK